MIESRNFTSDNVTVNYLQLGPLSRDPWGNRFNINYLITRLTIVNIF